MKRSLSLPVPLLALTAVYFCAGKLGLSLAFVNASASAVWPPTGLALAALLFLGYRAWPAIFVGAFLVNYTTSHVVGPSLAIAVGNTLEALVGALLTRRFAHGVAVFDRPAAIFRFVFFAAAPSTALSATIGVTTLAVAGLAPWNNYLPVWLTWWTGDFISDLVVAPLLVIWLTKTIPHLRPHRLAEAIALLLSIFLYGRIIFGTGLAQDSARHPLEHLGIPLLLWAVFRFRQRGAVTAAALMAAVAVWGTLRGAGPFAVGNPNDSLLLLQAFVGTSALTALVLAAVVTQHERSQAERQSLLEREHAARAQAERANRAKDQFLAVLSHELRTPLTPVLLTASIMESNRDLPQAVRDDAFTIRRNVELEARLIDDLLDLSRIANGKMALTLHPVNVHALLDAVHAMLESEAASKRISIHRSLDARNDRVNGDPDRLQQVLWNLLKNAIKFTPEGGAITLRTLDHTPERLAVEINDTGIGIAPAALDTIFAPFDQGRHASRFGGLGLGLSISKAIIEMHHGDITAQSPGEALGSTFTLTLPTTTAQYPTPQSHNPSKPEPNETSANRLRVLLVEDHSDTREALRRLLESASFIVTTAATVQSAIALVDQHPFDILVSDIGLPDGTGLDLLQRITARGSCIPAIALTGFGAEGDIKNSRQAGFAAHLTKPIDVRRLRATILDLTTTKPDRSIEHDSTA